MGWHAPFIFCIICCAVDFIGRMLVVEQRDAKLWLEEVEPKAKPKERRLSRRRNCHLWQSLQNLEEFQGVSLRYPPSEPTV
jgi:hypothetical protein